MNASGWLILVTGASSGIGRSSIEHLQRCGFTVVAGCRTAQAAEDLTHELHCDAIELDVTSNVDVVRAVAEIGARVRRNANRFALVNNAGIAIGGPVETLSDDDLRRQFEVNLFGPARLIRGFLPLLRSTKGRVINISSISGVLSFPNLGAYTASKFALEAFTDAMRMELREHDVAVSLIEPGTIKTGIWERSGRDIARRRAACTEEIRSLYRKNFDDLYDAIGDGQKRGISPDVVARTIVRCMRAKNPSVRYVVGADARIGVMLRRVLPDRLLDRIVMAL